MKKEISCAQIRLRLLGCYYLKGCLHSCESLHIYLVVHWSSSGLSQTLMSSNYSAYLVPLI